MTTSRPAYTGLQIALHWLIALLIVGSWLTGDGMGRLLRQKVEGSDPGIPLHGVIGVAILLLVLARIAVRLRRGAPDALPDASPTEATARKWGHRLLYLLLVAVPVGGLTGWMLPSRDIAEVHATVAEGLLIVAVIHGAIALWHHFGRRDETLSRMVPGLRASR